MNFIKLLPVIVSFGLLAAHFERADNQALMILCFMVPLLLFIKKKWVVRFLQILLLLGALEWLRTMLNYTTWRQEVGEPWSRLAIILIAVAFFTIFSVMVFRSQSLRERYKLK